jgi:hypothetical protein
MRDRTEQNYRGFHLVGMTMKGVARAVSFLPKGHRRHERTAGTLAEALAQVQADIDAELGALAGDRRTSPWGWRIPSADEYAHALAVIEPSALVAAMLKAHLHAPQRTMTATQIAHAAGAATYSVTNLHYGDFARQVVELLRLPAPEYKPGHVIWTGALAESLDGASDSDHFRWRMFLELAEALRRFNY